MGRSAFFQVDCCIIPGSIIESSLDMINIGLNAKVRRRNIESVVIVVDIQGYHKRLV